MDVQEGSVIITPNSGEPTKRLSDYEIAELLKASSNADIYPAEHERICKLADDVRESHRVLIAQIEASAESIVGLARELAITVVAAREAGVTIGNDGDDLFARYYHTMTKYDGYAEDWRRRILSHRFTLPVTYTVRY